jgi:SatD family (SatD)
MKHIILMADIIDSRLKNQKELMYDFREVVKEVNNSFATSLISPLTITLGDEFQGIIKNIEEAIKIVIFFEEELIHRQKYFKLRYVLNEGQIDTDINTTIAFEMLGEGLTDARYKLGKLKEGNHRFLILSENKVLNDVLNQSFIIFESIRDNWKTNKDYELVSSFFKYKDYKKIAQILNKNRSLIWKREKSLGIETYNAIKKIIESSIKLSL